MAESVAGTEANPRRIPLLCQRRRRPSSPPPQYCRTGLLQNGPLSPSAGCAVALIMAVVVGLALGDESCNATIAPARSQTREDTLNKPATAEGTKPVKENTEVWRDYDNDQLFEDYFNCGEILYGYDSEDDSSDSDYLDENEGPVSDFQLQSLKQQWAFMREKYAQGENLAQIKLNENEATSHGGDRLRRLLRRLRLPRLLPGRRRHGDVSAMVVPTRIGDAGPGKGRGVFATKPIPKGTLVVDLDNGNTGFFKEGPAWREYVVSLPRETACNLIEWSWVQNVSPKNDADNDIRDGLTILIAFDESNLMNNADWDGIGANVRCGRPPAHEGGTRGLCRFHYYAVRDIAVGEELLISYGEFEDTSLKGWADMGI